LRSLQLYVLQVRSAKSLAEHRGRFVHVQVALTLELASLLTALW